MEAGDQRRQVGITIVRPLRHDMRGTLCILQSTPSQMLLTEKS